jgi:hypothetical protein
MTATGVAALHMLVLGLGLGMTMQVLVLATQNAVPYDQLGVATSGATLFRSIGGSLGTAILGAIFSGRLTAELSSKAPPGTSGIGHVNPSQIGRLPAPARDAYISAFTDALHVVFLVATCVALVAFVLSWFIQELPLRATVATSTVGESFAAPGETDSLREISRGLMRTAGRERTLEALQGIADRAGEDVSPGGAWLVMRAGAPDAPDDIVELRSLPRVDPAGFDAALAELRGAGYVDGAGVTPAGREARRRLVVAGIACLHELVDEWQPGRDPELDPYLGRLAEELSEPAPAVA